MNLLSIIIIVLVVLAGVLGLIIGMFKGFTRVSSRSLELLLTGILVIPVIKAAFGEKGDGGSAVSALVITVVTVCVFMFAFMILRFVLKRKMEYRRKISYYKQYDEMEDNTEKILNAMGTDDKKAFKKLSNRKFRQSAGVWGLIDRIFGSVTLAIKGVVVAGLVSASLIMVLDFTRLAQEGGALFEFAGGIYVSEAWLFFKNYIFDFIIIGLIALSIKSGYSGGMFSSLWSLVVIAMVVGVGFLAFWLSFNAPDFISVAEKMNVGLSESLAGMSDTLEALGISTLTVAKIIIGLIVFVLMLIAVILIAIFIPKLIDKARDSLIFSTIDGILGAIMLTALTVGVLLLVGALANSLHDLEFMAIFNSYFEKSGVAVYFYEKNILNLYEIWIEIPIIKTWIVETPVPA